MKRFFSVFRTSLIQQLRSPWDLLLSLIFAPAIILIYWSFMGGGSTYYTVLVINQDAGRCPIGNRAVSCAEQAVQSMRSVTYESGAPLLKVVSLTSRAEADQKLRDRDAAALVIFPPDFSQSIADGRADQASTGSPVTFVGDLNNPYYSVAAVAASSALDNYLGEAVNLPRPVQVVEQPLGGSGTRTEFETYVPGLLIAAVTLSMFSVAVAVTHQMEAGLPRRLAITRMTALDYLGGISLLYVLMAMLSLLLAFGTAWLLGFRSQGPIGLAILICAITSIAVVGVGLITACLSRTSTRAAIVVNFPLVVLLFFTGAVFPPMKVNLFTIAGYTVRLFDLLPHTHAVNALNKVLSLGQGLSGIRFELAALTVLTVLIFALGVWLFAWKKSRA